MKEGNRSSGKKTYQQQPPRYDLHHSEPTGIIANMIIGDRLRALREDKGLSQGNIEKRTDLIRAYISRVQINHIIPNTETLKKMARALEVPLYVLFYDGEQPPAVPKLHERRSAGKIEWGDSRKGSLFLRNFRRVLGQVNDNDRRLLMFMANKMALHKMSKSHRAK